MKCQFSVNFAGHSWPASTNMRAVLRTLMEHYLVTTVFMIYQRLMFGIWCQIQTFAAKYYCADILNCTNSYNTHYVSWVWSKKSGMLGQMAEHNPFCVVISNCVMPCIVISRLSNKFARLSACTALLDWIVSVHWTFIRTEVLVEIQWMCSVLTLWVTSVV